MNKLWSRIILVSSPSSNLKVLILCLSISPVDHTRVKLSLASGDASSDYINASYVKVRLSLHNFCSYWARRCLSLDCQSCVSEKSKLISLQSLDIVSEPAIQRCLSGIFLKFRVSHYRSTFRRRKEGRV